MSNILSFPGNKPDGTPIVFADLVNDASTTKLLVLYTDTVAVKAQQFINDMIAGNPGDYISVLFLFVKEPQLILATLQTLSVNLGDPDHSLDWNQYANYRILSISPGNKTLSDAITAAELDEAYGSIKSAILYALNNG
jgi:hypothetical protein